jgi:hypothetical protein
MAPATLANLSCRLHVGAAARLDGREKNSTVCIRFLHLRGQKPIQGKTASSELQKGCLQLALEIQTVCWPEARKFETSDLEIALCMSKGGQMEGRILLRSRVSTSQEMEEDTLVGILMAFMLGNSVPRGPGVDLRWCPLTHRIGTTSCALTGVTVRRSLFNLARREVRFGHQRRGQAEWSLNNKKDPTLRRMIKVLTKATSGSDLLSFLKDRNWGDPADRRRKPRWDLLRLHQHEAHARGLQGLERSEITGQVGGRTLGLRRKQSRIPMRRGHDRKCMSRSWKKQRRRCRSGEGTRLVRKRPTQRLPFRRGKGRRVSRRAQRSPLVQRRR